MTDDRPDHDAPGAHGPGPAATPEEAGRAEDQPSAPRRRVPWSPWWRLAAAAATVGALTWGVSSSDAALQLGGGGVDPAGTTAAPAPDTFVGTALLGCPGLVPRSGDATGATGATDDDGASGEGSEDGPRVAVLAAAAPQSVLDRVPPSGTVEGGSAVTTAPADGTAATTGPGEDTAATTAPGDGASATAAPDDPATSSEGPVGSRVALELPGRPSPRVEQRHGVPVGSEVDGTGPALVAAAGDLAPGVVGGQLGIGTGAGSRGLSVAGCGTAREEQWLVGGGSAPGRSEQIVLTNPGPDAVTVEVSVWGTEGPVATTGGSGIVVPGGSRVVELLDGLAPSTDAPVVAVSATGGPVVAHLAETYREGTTDRGTEVVGPVAPPATDLVVPALPAAPEGHERQVVLRLAAPGDTQAVVDLTALTTEGAVRLTDHVTRVPAGRTVEVDLGDLPEGATGLRLRSDQPVTAAARLEVLPAEEDPQILEPAPSRGDTGDDPEAEDAGADADADAEDRGATKEAEEDERSDRTDQGEPLLRAAGDVAWVGATVPLATPTGIAVPGRGALDGAELFLAVSAVDGTTAQVNWVDEEGTETISTLELPNDTTSLVPLPDEARAVWVSSTGPQGVAAALHVTGADDRGPYVASATLPELPWLRQVTLVRPLVP